MELTFAERMTAWAAQQPDVEALLLIGSQVRAADDRVWRADAASDWDFQVVTREPERFARTDWTQALGLPLRAYAVRRAAISGLPKVAALFAGADADFVVLPASRMRLARWTVALGLHRRMPGLRRSLQDLAVVIRPGWRLLKGGRSWQVFLERVVAEVPDPRLGNDEVRNLAAGFVCDLVWTQRKIARGEWLAAQRMLHRELAETNFRLLHELKLRSGERSFPEARRAERVLVPAELDAVTVAATPDAESLSAAVEKCAVTCRRTVRALVGETWRWPE